MHHHRCTSGCDAPLIGYAASSGHLGEAAWILFAILFLWQFPHFHAIALMYREDYERGGIRMLAVVQPNGKAVCHRILFTLALLIPATIAPAVIHPSMAGRIYWVASILLGLGFLYFGIRLAADKCYSRARQLLLASVVYLPILFAILILDRP